MSDIEIEPQDLIGLLAVYMRREGIRQIEVSYAELAARPQSLLIARSETGGMRVRLPDADEGFADSKERELQAEADRSGKPVTYSEPYPGRKGFRD